jgi:rhodanese-related sulfurtransferase
MNKRSKLLMVTLVLVMVASVTVMAHNPIEDVLSGLKADKPWGMVQVKDAHELWQVKAATFIDVRTPEEYEEGHIPGAINVPVELIPDNLHKLPQDKDALIVVYCKSGWRASIGMVSVRSLGYSNAKGFNGSWLAWTEAGHDVKPGMTP